MHSYELQDAALSPVDTFTSEDYSAKNHAIRSAITLSKVTSSLFFVVNQRTQFTWKIKVGRVTALGIPQNMKGSE
jgi:hypothetical protein